MNKVGILLSPRTPPSISRGGSPQLKIDLASEKNDQSIKRKDSGIGLPPSPTETARQPSSWVQETDPLTYVVPQANASVSQQRNWMARAKQVVKPFAPTESKKLARVQQAVSHGLNRLKQSWLAPRATPKQTVSMSFAWTPFWPTPPSNSFVNPAPSTAQRYTKLDTAPYPLVPPNPRLQELSTHAISLTTLRAALYQHYQCAGLSTQPFSDQNAALDTCYANLIRLEPHLQPQPEPTALAQPTPACEPHSTRAPQRRMTLNHLFEPQTLRDGSSGRPKRILLQGQADSGKTAICKQLISDYQHKALGHDHFACVLWLPLAQLKTDQPLNLNTLLREHFFAHQANAPALAQTFERHRAQTLFILDGLDEVMGELDEGRPLRPLLQELLSQTHVLITSRPVGVNSRALGQFDLELETTGLHLDDVQAYIQKFIPESNQATIQQLMQSPPLTQGPANLPLLLEALCANWEKLRANEETTIAMLYEAIVNQLWRKDCMRLKKRHQGERLEPLALQNLPQAKLEELIATELQSLSYLAFKGLEAGTLAVNLDTLTQDKARLGIKSPFWLINDLKHSSFLHTTEVRRPEVEPTYHFLHSSMQEFFAAKFLAQHLHLDAQAEPVSAQANRVPSAAGLILSPAQLRSFIAAHKYAPGYAHMWQILAGLLKGAALERFFTLLEEEPRDLLGARHQQLMLRCAHAARAQLAEKTLARLEQEWLQWLRFEMTLNLEDVSALGLHPGFPEHLLLAYLQQPESHKASIMRTLGARSALSNHATQAIISVLLDQTEKKAAKVQAAETLGQPHILSKDVIQALSTVSKNTAEDEDVRIAVIKALGRQKPLTEAVILTLISALLDANWEIRYAAGKILGRMKKLPDTAIQVLLAALQNQETYIRSTAVEALGQQQPPSETVTQALIAVLHNKSEDKEVRAMAINTFGQQETLPEAALHALLTVLQTQGENEDLKSAAAEVFSWREPLDPNIMQVLISQLQDRSEREYVRSTAAQVLNRRQTLPEAVTQALSRVLQDTEEKESVRSSVAKALNNQETLSAPLTQALLSVFKGEQANENGYFRMIAAETLGQETILPEAIIEGFTEVLQNQEIEGYLRSAAIEALHRQAELPVATCQALAIALADPNEKIRSGAAMILSRQKTLPNEITQTWLKALAGTDQALKSRATKALNQHQTLPKHAKLALIEALQDQDDARKIEATKIFSRHQECPEEAIQAWNAIVKNQAEKKTLRSMAAEALGQQESLPETVIQTLVAVLEDKNDEESVISAVAKALNQQKIRPETVVQTWDTILKNKAGGKLARSAAAAALGQQKELPETLLQTLVEVLEDQSEEKYVKSAAAQALSQQEILPDAVLQTLVAILANQENDPPARSAITQILSLQIDRLYTLLPSLAPGQIQSLYASVLLPWSCAHIAPLYIHNNRLYFYTTAGLKSSVSLTAQQIAGLMNALAESNAPLRRRSVKEIQTHSHAYRSSPVEPFLIRKLAASTSVPSSEVNLHVYV